jgi:hypothetical protein
MSTRDLVIDDAGKPSLKQYRAALTTTALVHLFGFELTLQVRNWKELNFYTILDMTPTSALTSPRPPEVGGSYLAGRIAVRISSRVLVIVARMPLMSARSRPWADNVSVWASTVALMSRTVSLIAMMSSSARTRRSGLATGEDYRRRLT